nr:glycosyltransferase [Allomuricauda sp.]
MKKSLFIGHVWPEPNTTAAGHRMLQLLDAFQKFGYQITFASTAQKTEHSLDLDKKGITSVDILLNHSSFDIFVTELSPDVVVLDRFMVEEQFGWRVADFAPKAIRILNTEDLHGLRKAREEAHKKREPFTLDQWTNHPITLRELASIYRSDLSLMISSYELTILQETLNVPGNLLLHLPFMVENISKQGYHQWPSFEDRRDFVTVGNGRHAPNVDSIQVLKTKIWPLIRKELPDAQVHVYGAYLPQQIMEMHHPEQGFLVKGWGEDIGDIMEKARLVLAPIQFGAGIKGKLLDAMLYGTPSITTPIGAEGMQGNLPWNGTVCQDWESFSQAAILLYQNSDSWKETQANGVVLINTLYDKEKLQDQLQETLESLSQNLDAHRDQNFIGRLLQHHTLASSKYMAKWIEAKNRR